MKRVLTALALAALVFTGSTLGGAYSERIMARLRAQGSILAGTGTGHIKPMGLIQTLFDGVSANPATQNHYTCVPMTSIPANTLVANGDEIDVDFLASTTGTNTVQVWLNIGGTCASGATGFTGGTSIANSVAAVASQAYNGRLYIFKTGSNTQGMRYVGITPGVGLTASTYTTSAQTDTSAIPLILALRDTNASPDANAIVMQRVQVWFQPAAP